jgi:Cu2+-exporting ATPase
VTVVQPRPVSAAVGFSRTACAHCGAPLAPGDGEFCCTGCSGAHALVRGLGLDAFYRRQETAAGTLRPPEAPPATDFAALAQPGPGGTHGLDLIVSGLSCGACVWLVEQALAAEPDVTRARAALSTRRLSVAWRGGAERARDLAALIARLGFRVAPWSPACLRATEDAEGRALVRALGIAAFGAANVMLLSLAVWVGVDMGPETRHLLHWLAALVALPTVLVAGAPFYRSAWEAVRAGRVNMDLAVSIGVLAATAMSLSETLRNGEYTWFDSATSLLALLLAGRVLDRAMRRRARQAVAELLALQEGGVALLLPDGSTRGVPAGNVKPGDRLLVTAGERLRLDGTAAEPVVLDTSATTGESLPREISVGAALPAGAVNMGAPFVLHVTAAARDGSLAQLARVLERAEGSRGHFVSIADKAARLYVPVVHVIAAATFLGWWLGMGVGWQAALVPAVAALIVTCPCGLAIAVPAVQVAAVGALFRHGVLVASPTALERLAGADHAVLDKTGTLSEGRPELLDAERIDPGALRLAAGLARASRHPLAEALVRACPDAPALDGVREIPGRGLVRGSLRLGSRLLRRGGDRALRHDAVPGGGGWDAGGVPFRGPAARRCRRVGRGAARPRAGNGTPLGGRGRRGGSGGRGDRRRGLAGAGDAGRQGRADRGAARRGREAADGRRRHQRRGGAGAGACLGQPRDGNRHRAGRLRHRAAGRGAVDAAAGGRRGAAGTAPGGGEHRLQPRLQRRRRADGGAGVRHAAGRRAGDGEQLSHRHRQRAAGGAGRPAHSGTGESSRLRQRSAKLVRVWRTPGRRYSRSRSRRS